MASTIIIVTGPDCNYDLYITITMKIPDFPADLYILIIPDVILKAHTI